MDELFGVTDTKQNADPEDVPRQKSETQVTETERAQQVNRT